MKGVKMYYELIKVFECNGKEMVIVKVTDAAHVMDKEEWKKVFGKWHPERWNNGKHFRLNHKKTV